MRDFKKVALAVASLALFASVANAQISIPQENTNIGTSSGEFLQLGAGARGMALGGSFSALVQDVEALYYNPAGLPLMQNGLETALTVMPYFADTDYYWLGLAFPFSAGQYAIGFSLGNFGFADQPIYTESDPENTAGETYSVSETFVAISFAHAFIDRFTGGITVKYIQDRLAKASASAFAVDVGTNFHTELAGRPIAFAVVIQNLGGNLEHSGSGLDFDAFPQSDAPDVPVQNVDPAPSRYRTQAFPLPTTFRVGLVYDVLSMEASRLSVLGEFVEQNSTNPGWGLAAEYQWAPPEGPVNAAVRGSYSYQSDNNLSEAEEQEIGARLAADNRGLDGLALGAGLGYQFSQYEARLDYTYRHFGYLGSSNVFTLGFKIR